ncbi:DUF2249 domain-containing protein [Agriterribacter sp.]|uniref:DUF2249 domain-containing protein n=1 Tax=Agriterribacter sp. TaxID=2821509 RepID=UPI002C5C885A|nr:DUF2249 domain-containing protein [Agriterribacter sp.]HRO46433.1 DUF2249 domain-containing protein [Agriterribacter sp.]HRQ17332.1 DUF2249 domain-containing protein [Agriterribacter sp.]
MMMINAGTRIAAILKQSPAALDAIIAVSPKFEKLRNPILRKVMAGRTSLAMAAKVGGCTVEDFFMKLKPLGFETDTVTIVEEEVKKPLPAFISTLKKEQLIELDVRPVIASGKDPLSIIVQKVKTIQPGQVLKIINSFEPTPLMALLEKQGFVSYADTIKEDWVETYFYKTRTVETPVKDAPAGSSEGWDMVLEQFEDRIKTIDVRHLEMPGPMITILASLETLPADTALYVYHKRIPVFLLPELADRKFGYRIKEISDGEVHLLIFKD